MNLAERLLDPVLAKRALQDIEAYVPSDEIDGQKAHLTALTEAVAELHRRLAAAKAEGAAEAYEAEAQDWEALAKSVKDLQSQTARRAFERRAVEARERAATLRKQAER